MSSLVNFKTLHFLYSFLSLTYDYFIRDGLLQPLRIGNFCSILYILLLDNSTDAVKIYPPNLIKILIHIAFKHMYCWICYSIKYPPLPIFYLFLNIIFKQKHLLFIKKMFVNILLLSRINRRCGRNGMPLIGCSCCEILVCVEVSKW